MYSIRALTFVLAILAMTVSFTQAGPLGVAQNFNGFIFDSFQAEGGDTEGRLAVGGHASIKYYSVGFALTNSFGTSDNLVVGGNLDADGGWQVYNGNAVYGQSLINAPTTPNGSVRQDSVIDFAAAYNDLSAKSTAWANLPTNGTSQLLYSTLHITGTDPVLNVFDVDPADWAAASDRQITAPAGSTVLINIAGSTVSMSGGLALNGVQRENVLYNFHQATAVNMSSIAIRGSVLAPDAHLDLAGGHIDGTSIFQSGNTYYGGEFHHYPFTGTVPEPTTLGLLTLGTFLCLRPGSRRRRKTARA